MFELYHSPFSTCSQKVRLALAEKGLDYESHPVNLANQEHLSPEYLALNPNGVVPTLVHNGDVVLDSSVICEYIDEVVPGLNLSPTDPILKAKMRSWMRYFEEVPTTAIRVPSFNRLFVKGFNKMPDTVFNAMTERMPLRKRFYQLMRERAEGFDEQAFDESIAKLSQTLLRMEEALGAGPWLLGGEFTIADIVVIPTIVRMDDIGLQYLWAELPRVSEWYDRVQQRPSFAKAYFPGARVSMPTTNQYRDQ